MGNKSQPAEAKPRPDVADQIDTHLKRERKAAEERAVSLRG
jgi:hypothetical protein